MAELAVIYWRLVAARVRADWQYRASFILTIAGTALTAALDFAAITIIFVQVPHLADWSFAEVAFLYGSGGIAFGLADMTAGNVDYAASRIKAGTFDQLLIRPLGAGMQLSAEHFSLRRLGKVFQAVAVLLIALSHLDLAWTPGRLAVLLVMLVSGFVIFSSIWVMGASIAFWAVDSGELSNSVTYGGNTLTQFPLPVYAGWLRRLAIFVIPLAFVNYFPCLYILGRTDPLGFPPIVQWAGSPLAASWIALVARAVWRIGLRHHRSTGS